LPGMTSHPSYAHPAVVEALCEIHFELAQGRSWEPSLVDSFHERVREQYPEVETVQELSVELNLGPGGVQQRSAVQGERHRFRHRDRPVILQMKEGIFTVNHVSEEAKRYGHLTVFVARMNPDLATAPRQCTPLVVYSL
jgi:uncharacterized protein (TIGR04255 family)